MTAPLLMETERLLDEAGLAILYALQDDARVSFAELGRRVGLSGPAITDRVRKMEEAGIITGYHATVNAAKLGFPIVAWARVRVSRDHFQRVIALARDIPEVRKCHHAQGDGDFLLELMASSEAALAVLEERFREYGELNICIMQSTPVEKYSG